MWGAGLLWLGSGRPSLPVCAGPTARVTMCRNGFGMCHGRAEQVVPARRPAGGVWGRAWLGRLPGNLNAPGLLAGLPPSCVPRESLGL